jgi:flagellar protein FliO/FliZ
MINSEFDSLTFTRLLSKTRRAFKPALTFLLTSAWITTPAWAQSSSGTGAAGAWFGLITLTLLVVLAAVVLWLFKKGRIVGATDSGIDILAMQSLGPREQIVVIRVNGRILVLGHTASQINLLAELANFQAPAPRPGGLPKGFQAQLNNFLKGKAR